MNMNTASERQKKPVCVVTGDEIAAYGFPDEHPFGPDRHKAFVDALDGGRIRERITHLSPRLAKIEELASFHTQDYIALVEQRSQEGTGFLDMGDTPVFPNMFESARFVVGSTLAAIDEVMSGRCGRGFVPIGGLHHAGRSHAAGFCVFNDCGVALEQLKRHYGLSRVAYVDIDAHHGDGVFYSFEKDPAIIFADIHEDGSYLYPGTGRVDETGVGEAQGTKLNIPLEPGAGNTEFFEAWETVEAFLGEFEPEFVVMQCGADSLAGDPITHLRYTEAAHTEAARNLCRIADRYAKGRIVGLGGGGYNLRNLARAWSGVVRAFLET